MSRRAMAAVSRISLRSCSVNTVRGGVVIRAIYPCLDLPQRAIIHTGTRNLADEMKNTNPFFDKYKEKLEKAGGSTAAFNKLKGSQTAADPAPQPGVASTQYPFTKPPSLDNIMRTDLIMDKSAEEISQIWREYYSDKDHVSAVIPSDVYIQLQAKASMCPLFIFPLPKDEGFEFMFSQFNGYQFHFTTLLNYQLHQENAPVCLNLCHYTELQQSKGVVLMSGEYDAKVIKPMEAQFLANQVQLYYASNDQERFNLVKQFNHHPDEFDYQLLIDQLKNAGIGLLQQANNQ